MKLFYKLMSYTIFFSSIRMLVGGYSSLYLIKHGLTIADISFLKAFQGLIIVAIQLPIGFAIDKFNNRYPFVLLSLFLAAIWLFLTGTGNNALCFYIAELFNALSLATFNAVMLPILVETYTYETGKDDYNYTMGRFFKYQNLLMAGSVIFGSAFVTIDSRNIWLVSALLLMIIGIFSIMSRDIKAFNFNKERKSQKKFKHHFQSVFLFLKSENLTVIFLANISLLTIFQILAQFWQIILYDYLGNSISYALVYGLIFSLILILQAIGAHIAEKKNSLQLSAVFLFIMIFTTLYLIMHNSQNIASSILIGLFLALFFLFKYPSIIINALVHTNVDNEIRATFDSLISTVSMIFSIFIFYLLGIFLNKYGNNIILLTINILTVISCTCITIYLLKIKYSFKSKLSVI